MLYATYLGPVSVGGRSVHMIFGMDRHGVKEAVADPSLRAGLTELVRRVGRGLVAAPGLAKEALALGLQVEPLPAEVRLVRGALAVTMALGLTPSLELLRALQAFLTCAAELRDVVSWDELTRGPITVTVDGRRREVMAYSRPGEDPTAIVFTPELGVLGRLDGGVPSTMKRLASSTAILLDGEPAFARAALREDLGLPFVPLVVTARAGALVPATAADVLEAAAVARAIAAGPAERDRPLSASVLDPAAREPAPRAGAAKAGRNDPCPCGSGKKYKRCCLLSAPARAGSTAGAGAAAGPATDPLARALALHTLEERLARRVVEHADRRWPGWQHEVVGAFTRGGERLPITDAWLAFGADTPDGRRAAEVFLAERSGELSTREIEWLESQRAEYFSVLEVVTVEPEIGFELLDLLTGRRVFVHDRLGSAAAPRRVAVFGRLGSADGLWIITASDPKALEPRAADAVVAAVRRKLKLGQGAVDPAALRTTRAAEVLRRAWVDSLAAAERKAERTRGDVRNTDGDPFLWTEDHFTFDPSRRASLIEGLLRLPGAAVDEEASSETRISFARPGNLVRKAWDNTLVGAASVRGGALVLETNSLARADRLRELVGSSLGDALTPVERTHPMAHVPVTPRNTMVDAQRFHGMDASAAEHLLRDEYRVWLDEPLGALGGKTPREAVESAKGRRALHLLLKEIERSERREDESMGAWLRQELSLTDEGAPASKSPEVELSGHGAKLSEALLDFAMPMMNAEHMSGDHAGVERAMALAVEIWNEEAGGGPAPALGDDLPPGFTRVEHPEPNAELRARWSERLRDRKRRIYAADRRVVALWNLVWGPKGPTMKAACVLDRRATPRRARRSRTR